MLVVYARASEASLRRVPVPETGTARVWDKGKTTPTLSRVIRIGLNEYTRAWIGYDMDDQYVTVRVLRADKSVNPWSLMLADCSPLIVE